MDSPDVRRGDSVTFEKFAHEVKSLVGLLRTLGPDGDAELKCGSHVTHLLSKLPAEQRADFRKVMFRKPNTVYTLVDVAEWLQFETYCHNQNAHDSTAGAKDKPGNSKKRVTTILHGSKDIPIHSSSRKNVINAIAPSVK